jgi:hypothetical protein
LSRIDKNQNSIYQKVYSLVQGVLMLYVFQC